MYRGDPSYGCHGRAYDRYALEHSEDSGFEKLKQHYWTAKQTIISKLKKKEDEHLSSADAELDAKLETFHATRRSCVNLLRCIEYYQDYICDLSQAENSLGRFLKEKGKADKTQAGKMMVAFGRAQSFTAQQRLALRVPLVRLYQELDVFTERAVADAAQTVEAMEKARTEYRGALLWMKKVSEELDPDMYNRLEKFRKVQGQVKRAKSKFDKLKLDVLQKTDLLSASRCNLFSQVLANYQNCLLAFWDKTAKAHKTVAESFKGYQHYEFVVVKELQEPSRRLAELTSGRDQSENTSEQSFAKPKEMSQHSPEGNTQLVSLTAEKKADSIENLLFHDSPESEVPKSTFENASSLEQQLDDLLKTVEQRPSDPSNTMAFPDFLEFDNTSSSESQAKSLPEELTNPLLPSQLLESSGFLNSLPGLLPQPVSNMKTTSAPAKPMSSNAKRKTEDQAAWFNLFADIDPLKNPDAIGNATDDGRNC